MTAHSPCRQSKHVRAHHLTLIWAQTLGPLQATTANDTQIIPPQKAIFANCRRSGRKRSMLVLCPLSVFMMHSQLHQRCAENITTDSRSRSDHATRVNSCPTRGWPTRNVARVYPPACGPVDGNRKLLPVTRRRGCGPDVWLRRAACRRGDKTLRHFPRDPTRRGRRWK